MNKFDSLYESLLNEMMPMSFDDYGAVTGVIDSIVSNIMSARGNQGHWSKAFTSKKLKGIPDSELEKAMKDMVTDVVHKLFPEKGNTYSPDLTKENFREKIQNTIKNSFDINSTYSKFLSDRFANSELLGKAKEVMEVIAAAGVESSVVPQERGVKLVEVPKQGKTQNDINKALAKYLSSKGEEKKSVWDKSGKDKPVKTAEPDSSTENESEAEIVYMKAADLSSDDPNLAAAFKKLPDNKELSYEQIVKLVKTTINGRVVGRSLADKLIELGGVDGKVKERETGEDDEVPDLEIDNEDNPDLKRHIRDIDMGFSGFTRKGFGGDLPDF